MKKLLLSFRIAALGLLVSAMTFVGCTKSTPTETTTPKPMVNPTNGSEVNAAKQPGTHCFAFKDGNHSIEGRLELTAGNEVVGTLKGHQIDEATGTDNMYDTSFDGRLQGDSLKLNVLSSATGNKEKTNQTWVWKKEGLQEGEHLLLPVSCVN